jgi:hypothetical protein
VDRQVVVEKVDDVSSQMEVDVTLSTPEGCPINGMVSSGPTCFMGSSLQLLALIASSSSKGIIENGLDYTLDATNCVLKLILHILKVQTLTDELVQELQTKLWKSFPDGNPSIERALRDKTVGPHKQMDITGPLTEWLLLFTEFINAANGVAPPKPEILTTFKCSRCNNSRQSRKVEPHIPFIAISIDRVETFQQMLDRHFSLEAATDDQFFNCPSCTFKDVTPDEQARIKALVIGERKINKRYAPELHLEGVNASTTYQLADETDIPGSREETNESVVVDVGMRTRCTLKTDLVGNPDFFFITRKTADFVINKKKTDAENVKKIQQHVVLYDGEGNLLPVVLNGGIFMIL